MTEEPLRPWESPQPNLGAEFAPQENGGQAPGLAPRPTPKWPFWGYGDLVLLIGFFFASFLISGLLFAGVRKAFPLLKGKEYEMLLLLVFQVVIYALGYLSMHITLASRYGRPVLPSLGWKVPPVNLLIPAVGGLLLPFVVNLIIVPFHPPKIELPFEKFTVTPWLMVCFGVIAALLAPVMEELVFRGFLQPLISRDLGTVAGVLITAMLFGALHAPEYSYAWQFVAAVTLAGIAFGAMRAWTDSTLASSIMHGGFNLVMVVAMFASPGKR